MAPEIRGDGFKYTKSVDIYSLGVILLELAAGADYHLDVIDPN